MNLPILNLIDGKKEVSEKDTCIIINWMGRLEYREVLSVPGNRIQAMKISARSLRLVFYDMHQ